jgi:DNA-binding NtrC family response regulator
MESWIFPQDGPPITLVSEAVCPPVREKEGVRYANTSIHDSAYLAWHRPLPVDGHDFEIRLVFRPDNLPIPRLLVRGVKYARNASPDITGYAVSSSVNSGALKKNTNYVHEFRIPPSGSDGDNLLVMAKTRDRFTLDLNKTRLFDWTETVPFLLETDNLFYLFLKPGEGFLFKSITVSSRPSGNRHPGRLLPPLRAMLKSSSGVHEYNVHVDQRAVNFHDSHRNVTLYQLEDITDLKQDIDTLQQERDRLRHILLREKTFIGNSAAITAIRAQLATVADSNLSVLIQGETGTGKEVLAQAIHNLSARKDKPFIKIDCLAIPETLIESELFGHEKGAFTGAVASYAGRFEQAQGGTVFLDEAGNLPPSVQAKLLGVLQDRKIQRVGGAKTVPLDFRLIAASNTPLEQLIARGKFRQDLFYRLNQLLIPLPPLRDRREDIPLLAEQFLGEANQVYQKKVGRISPQAARLLYNAPWPGNIRELKNVVLKGALFCEGDTLEEKHVSTAALDSRGETVPDGKTAGSAGGVRTKCGITKKALLKTLSECGGHVKNASRKLNISRNMTYVLIRKYRVKLSLFRR